MWSIDVADKNGQFVALVALVKYLEAKGGKFFDIRTTLLAHCEAYTFKLAISLTICGEKMNTSHQEYHVVVFYHQ